MREIKFRAWDKKQKLMRIVYSLIDIHHVSFRVEVDKHTLEELDYNDVEIMQYTWLKDKNGKEIYEGDIIKAPKAMWVVVWKESGLEIEWKVNGYKNHSINLLLVKWSCDRTLEVIWNIYENPEFLNS